MRYSVGHMSWFNLNKTQTKNYKQGSESVLRSYKKLANPFKECNHDYFQEIKKLNMDSGVVW